MLARIAKQKEEKIFFLISFSNGGWKLTFAFPDDAVHDSWR